MKNTLMLMLIGILLWAIPTRSMGFRDAFKQAPESSLSAPSQPSALQPEKTGVSWSDADTSSHRSAGEVLWIGVIAVCFLALRRLR